MFGFLAPASGTGVLHSRRAGVSRCGRRRLVVRANVDVTNFPSEGSKDAVDVNKRPQEYVQLKEMLKGVSIFMIGMMGSGKSAVGKVLAQQIGYAYVDTDEVIQESMKMPITDIFEEHGEAGFRQVESVVIQQVSPYVRTVISAGGGAVLSQENWGHMQNGFVVWLDPSVETIYQRVKGSASRPLLKVDDPRAMIESILRERKSLYEQADVKIGIEPEEGVEVVAFNTARGLTRFIEANPPKSAAYRPLGL